MIEKAEAAEVTWDKILERTPNKKEIKVYSTRSSLLKKKIVHYIMLCDVHIVHTKFLDRCID